MMTSTRLQEALEKRSEELARSEREAERDHRRAIAATLAGCVFWLAIGLLLIGWSIATTSERYARAAFLSGIVVGNAGMLYTLARAYIKAEERGDL
jgi:hypothetical protein